MTNSSNETRARNIIERLKIFNRKERDHLMKFALSETPDAPTISSELWEMISNGGTKPNADRMFIGMDYHLNWLYAALATSHIPYSDLKKGTHQNAWSRAVRPNDGNEQPIKRNQEDVDLLIAWFDERWSKPLRLVLIEAKLDSGWISDQLDSKRNRLSLIQQDAELRGLNFLDWRLILMSPRGDEECKIQINGFSCESATPESWHDILKQRARVERVSETSEEWVIV